MRADPLCISLPPTRNSDARVITHADATAIAAKTPNPRAPGAGGLPLPRSVLEAMSFIAFARASGVFSFWAASPDTSNGNVVLHWITEGGANMEFKQGETRCIIVSSVNDDVSNRMYAHFRECDAHLADGIVSVAAASAPPPPPGGGPVTLFTTVTAPPPPPSVKAIAFNIWKKREVMPRTEAICSGRIGEGEAHVKLCREALNFFAKWQPILTAGVHCPLCLDMCWHSCSGTSYINGADDGFIQCTEPECAKTACVDFLRTECPPKMHDEIDQIHNQYCQLVPPAPPRPPRPPPSPPFPPSFPPPVSPPPKINFVQRDRDTEVETDEDCQPVDYATCLEVVKQFADEKGAGYSAGLRMVNASKALHQSARILNVFGSTDFCRALLLARV